MSPQGEADWRVCEMRDTTGDSGPALETFCEAYRALRIQHQLGYANYKLTTDGKISDLPRVHSELLASVSKFGIQFVILVHICVLVIIVASFLGRLLLGFQTGLEAAMAVTGIFAFAIIALAVMSLCAHAFAQGLQPEREVERYQQYGSVLKSLLDQFDEAGGAAEKLKVMQQVDRAAINVCDVGREIVLPQCGGRHRLGHFQPGLTGQYQHLCRGEKAEERHPAFSRSLLGHLVAGTCLRVHQLQWEQETMTSVDRGRRDLAQRGRDFVRSF